MDYSELNLELLGTVGDEWLEDAVVYGDEEDDDDEETERASRSRQRRWGQRVRRFESGEGPDPWEEDEEDEVDPANWVVSVSGNLIKYNNKLYSKLEYNDTTRQLTCYTGDNIETVYSLMFVQCD